MSYTVPIYGFGGGNAALNFKVLAYVTEEELLTATPAENTIGVITETPITSWIFSSTEPSPAEPGMVWIYTGTSSVIEFNALKKNGIQVYPISAKQYLSGAWVDTTAKIYQGGEWVDWWNGELYDAGNQYVNITGGWSGSGYYASSGTTVKAGTINEDNLYLGAAGSSAVTSIGTQQPIDLTDYNYVHFTVTATANGNNFVCGVAETQDMSNRASSVIKTADTTGVISVDISTLSGPYYVLVMTSGSAVATITKVVLE